LAKLFNGEIINGDSMQVYRGLDAITNKHPVPERKGIPHHLLGHIDWSHEYSVKQFEEEVTAVIDSIHARGKLPILVGGTHYYNQTALFKNSTVSSVEVPSEPLNEKQIAILDSPDPLTVFKHLQQVDPVVSQKFHPNDTRRVRRALEIYFSTGQRASDLYAQQGTRGESGSLALRYRSLVLWVWCEKTVLNDRLDARVDQMVGSSLYSEINQLYKEHIRLGKESVDLERGIWQVIGYKQFLPWLEGTDKSPENGIEKMKIGTRQYATRQTKWISKKLISLLAQVHDSNPECKGDVALLDATDLSVWDKNVSERGAVLVKEFLAGTSYSIPLVPPELEDLALPRAKELEFSREQWKHHICKYCKDKEGNPVTIVGNRPWEMHLKSKGHIYYERQSREGVLVVADR
jgi:tRNA dimethylallyltransferase